MSEDVSHRCARRCKTRCVIVTRKARVMVNWEVIRVAWKLRREWNIMKSRTSNCLLCEFVW
jgi:hypothetical protein